MAGRPILSPCQMMSDIELNFVMQWLGDVLEHPVLPKIVMQSLEPFRAVPCIGPLEVVVLKSNVGQIHRLQRPLDTRLMKGARHRPHFGKLRELKKIVPATTLFRTTARFTSINGRQYFGSAGNGCNTAIRIHSVKHSWWHASRSLAQFL